MDSNKSEELLIQARKILEPLSPLDETANVLKSNITAFETNLFRPEKLFKLAQYYKITDPARAGLYLKGALNTVLNVKPDQEFVRRLIPLFKELFPDESTEEMEAFAAGKPSPSCRSRKTSRRSGKPSERSGSPPKEASQGLAVLPQCTRPQDSQPESGQGLSPGRPWNSNPMKILGERSTNSGRIWNDLKVRSD